MKAVVTGHSRGLGAALAAQLIGRGIPVLGIARAHTGLAQEVQLDLADSAALAAWLSTGALADFAAGDELLLINNAGTVEPVGALAQQDPAMVARSVALNVAAPMMLASAVALLGPCRIVHISSGAGRNAYPGWSVYCATKSALDHHARAAHQDGARICSLAPGVIDTDMQALIRATPEERFPIRARFVEMQRDGALDTPADCARRLVAYVLSERFGREPVADLRQV